VVIGNKNLYGGNYFLLLQSEQFRRRVVKRLWNVMHSKGLQEITVENRYADILMSYCLQNKFTTNIIHLVVNEFRGHIHYILANIILTRQRMCQFRQWGGGEKTRYTFGILNDGGSDYEGNVLRSVTPCGMVEVTLLP
jgi:hypothetical protein